jgi:hypothetical protein
MNLLLQRRLPREVTDVLRDDPELKRLAERVAILSEDRDESSLRQRRLLLPALAVGALTAVAIAAVLVLTNGGSAPSLTDRALGAIGRDRVLHVVTARTITDDRTVDLATGRQLPARVSIEAWFDERSARLHVMQRRNGGLVADVLGPRRSVARTGWRLDPGLALFLTGYRRALREHRVRDLGPAVVHGRDVRWLALPSAERVAVDGKSFRPVVIQKEDGSRWSVSQIESVPLSAADFRRPRLQAAEPSFGEVFSRRRVSRSQAARLLRLPALWLGRRWSELRLGALNLERFIGRYPRQAHHRPLRPRGLFFTYGSSRAANIVELREARRPLSAYGFGSRLTFGFDPIPREGSMQLTATGGAWLGQLYVRGLYITITGPDPVTVIRVASELRPIPR